MHLKMTRVQLLLCLLVPVQFLTATAQTWTQAPEIGIAYVNAITEQSGVLYCCTDSLVYASADGGASWHPTVQQPGSFVLNRLYAHDGFLYVGTRGDGVFRTSVGGDSWQNTSTGLAGDARRIAEFTVRGDSLYAGTDGAGVWVLNLQNPLTWTSYNDGLFQFGTTTIITSGDILVAGIGQYVFVRPPGAAKWTEVVFDSLFGRTPLKVFGLDSVLFLGTTGGVFRGTSDGAFWQKADIAQLPNRNVAAFASQGSRLFAGASSAQHWIFSTDDFGTTWELRAHEFADLLALYPANGRLWAGRSDGLWWADLDVWTGVEDPAHDPFPADLRLHQNYPNPFNPSTTIRFELQASLPVRLVIYDLLGRELEILGQGMMEAGRHAITWQPRGLPSGSYFYRLEAGGSRVTRRMVLVK